MKKFFIVFLLGLPLCLSAQEVREADALVVPRIAEREISVGGENADVHGFTNQSI